MLAADDETALLDARADDFYLELGGTIILDLDDLRPNEAVRELYARLVKPEDPPAPVSLKEKSLRSLRLAGADLDDEDHFKEDISVELDVGGRRFEESMSYGVRAGTWHYLQEVAFDPQRPRRSRKEANHCAFLMEHTLIDGSRLVLYDAADIDETTAPMLELVSAIVPVVDVSDPDAAVASLAEQPRLDASGSRPGPWHDPRVVPIAAPRRKPSSRLPHAYVPRTRRWCPWPSSTSSRPPGRRRRRPAPASASSAPRRFARQLSS